MSCRHRDYIKRYAFKEITPETDRIHKRHIEYFTQIAIATPKWIDWREMNKVYRRAKKLRSMGHDVVVDHIVPLRSKYVCGLNWHGNIQILDRVANHKKMNFWWQDMWNEQQLLPLDDNNTHQLSLGV